MDEKNTAMKLAMKLIGLRRRSIFEIEEKLRQKNYSEKLVMEVIAELKKFRYLDDSAFAESFVRDRINLRPCGARLIERELKSKGISSDIIQEKIQALVTSEKEAELAGHLAEKKIRSMKKNEDKNKARAKLASYLSSKGFSFDLISQTLKDKLK